MDLFKSTLSSWTLRKTALPTSPKAQSGPCDQLLPKVGEKSDSPSRPIPTTSCVVLQAPL